MAQWLETIKKRVWEVEEAAVHITSLLLALMSPSRSYM